ncbi:MAG: TfoX/Sxy family protein [Gemmatimonadetes bacterium]|nr:TfoX/Sxy family protein [Gemmatimonadota bacterium]
MGSDRDFVDFVVDQIDADCAMTSKSMFGEYGLYSHGIMVAMVCDNRLFVKRTEAGEAYIGAPVFGSPYPGAKPIFLIEDRVEDGPWLSELLRITRAALPPPRKKRSR